jgi:methionyl aminopeptidase
MKEGALLVDVVEKIEEKVSQLGGAMAFPAQISRNNLAAHYCPDIEDKTELLLGDMAKLDLGINIEGCISDTACTVYLGEDERMKSLADASRLALDNVSKIMKDGIEIGKIGEEIQRTISSMGFSPIRNLSGHGLAKFNIHSEPSIPNFATTSTHRLSMQAVAIEPFATFGAGKIVESGNANVFAMIQHKQARDNITRKVLAFIEDYDGLPFARRWLEQEFPRAEVAFALRNLVNNEVIMEYPPLGEISKAMVSQAEHTFLLTKDGVIISTK